MCYVCFKCIKYNDVYCKEMPRAQINRNVFVLDSRNKINENWKRFNC